MVMGERLNESAVRAGFGYTIGNILFKGCTFLTLPVFARLLSTSDYGIYTTYLAYESIISSLIGLGIYGGIKNAKLKYESVFEQYMSSIVFLVCSVFIIILLAIVPFLSSIRIKTGFSNLIVYTLLCQAFSDAIIQIYTCRLNVEFKYKSYLFFSSFITITNILLSIFLIVVVFPNERFLGRIWGTSLPIVTVCIFVLIMTFSKGKCLLNREYIKYALLLGIPLVPHVLSQSILSQFDRIMIKEFVGSSEAGIYSFIYTLSTILLVISNSLDNAWTPWMYLMRKEHNEHQIEKPSQLYIMLFSLLTIGFMCVMPEVTELFGTREYYDGIDLIIPLSLSNYFMFLYFLPVNLEYYSNKTYFISIGTILTGIINFGLNYFCIPIWGYKAAAYTTLISYAFLFLIHCIIAKKYDFFRIYNIKYILKVILIMLGISLVLYFIGKTELDILIRYMIVILITIYLVINTLKYYKNKGEKK